VQEDPRKEKSGVSKGRKHPKWHQPPAQQDSALGACWTSGQSDTSLPTIVPIKGQLRVTAGVFSGWACWSICQVHVVLAEQSSPCLCTCHPAEL